MESASLSCSQYIQYLPLMRAATIFPPTTVVTMAPDLVHSPSVGDADLNAGPYFFQMCRSREVAMQIFALDLFHAT